MDNDESKARKQYRARVVSVDGNECISRIEQNLIDPSASRRNYQDALRHDRQYIELLTQYRDNAKELYRKCQNKNSKSSKRVHVLQSEIMELQKQIKEREAEIRKSSIVYAIVPLSDYVPMDETEALETVSLLKKKSIDELLTKEKKLVKRVTT